MRKPSSKPKVTQKLGRSVLDPVAPDAAAPKKKPPRPAKKQDAADVDRAESEGMGQPQGQPPKKKKSSGNRAG